MKNFIFTTRETIKKNTHKQYPSYDITGYRIDVGSDGYPTEKGWEQAAEHLKKYGDSDYESSRYLFINKEGLIVRHLSFSDGIPDSTNPYPSESELNEIRDYCLNNDTKLIFAHNHPNNFVEPSTPDIKLTNKFESLFTDNSQTKRFAGHIILDTGAGTYGFFETKSPEWKIHYNHKNHSFEEYYKDISSRKVPYYYNIEPGKIVKVFDVSESDTGKKLAELEKQNNTDNIYDYENFIPVFFLKQNGLLEHLEYIPIDYFDNYDSLDFKLQNIGTETGCCHCVMLPSSFEQFSLCSKYAEKSVTDPNTGKKYPLGIVDRVYCTDPSSKGYLDSIYNRTLFDFIKKSERKTMRDDSLDYPFGYSLNKIESIDKNLVSVNAQTLIQLSKEQSFWELSHEKASEYINFFNNNNIKLYYDDINKSLFLGDNGNNLKKTDVLELENIVKNNSVINLQFQKNKYKDGNNMNNGKTETVEKKLNDYFKEYADNENCTIEEAKKAVEEEWGKSGLRGYAVFGNGDGFDKVDCICRIDDMNIYDSDLEAAEYAEADGIKLIGWEEQPRCYPYLAYRFIDTSENRKALLKSVKEYKNKNYEKDKIPGPTDYELKELNRFIKSFNLSPSAETKKSFSLEEKLVELENWNKRIDIARQLKENMPNLTDGERAAAISILEGGAKSMSMSLSDYMDNTYPNGLFGILDKFEDKVVKQHQTNGEEINGGVDVRGFGKDAQALIYVSKTGDFSTFVHEVAHVWQAQLTGKLKKDAEKAFQVKNGDWRNSDYVYTNNKTEKSNEAFAYGFEDFLKHKATELATKENKHIFEKFADYMSRTYNGLNNNINISDEIAEVYNSFLLLDDNILSAAEQAVYEENIYSSEYGLHSQDDKYYLNPENTQYQLISEASIRRLGASYKRNEILSLLSEAIELENQPSYKNRGPDSSAALIKLATNWEKDAFGVWKYETDDSMNKFKFKKNIYDKLQNNPGNLLVLNNANTTLGSILEADELYEYFPVLKKVKIRFYSDIDDTRALLDSDGILVNVKNLNGMTGETGLLGVISHEVQHIIQAIEFTGKTEIENENLEELYNKTMKEMREHNLKFYNYDVNSINSEVEKYIKDFGEIEARNVARRVSFKFDQRKANTLKHTESFDPSVSKNIQYQVRNKFKPGTNVFVLNYHNIELHVYDDGNKLNIVEPSYNNNFISVKRVSKDGQLKTVSEISDELDQLALTNEFCDKTKDYTPAIIADTIKKSLEIQDSNKNITFAENVEKEKKNSLNSIDISNLQFQTNHNLNDSQTVDELNENKEENVDTTENKENVFTWDDLYARADGAAWFDSELKAKDNARAYIGDYAKEHFGIDIEAAEIPEEEIDRFLEEHPELNRFNEDGQMLVDDIEVNINKQKESIEDEKDIDFFTLAKGNSLGYFVRTKHPEILAEMKEKGSNFERNLVKEFESGNGSGIKSKLNGVLASYTRKNHSELKEEYNSYALNNYKDPTKAIKDSSTAKKSNKSVLVETKLSEESIVKSGEGLDVKIPAGLSPAEVEKITLEKDIEHLRSIPETERSSDYNTKLASYEQKLKLTNVISFDTETTGFEPPKEELLQISIVNGNGTEVFNHYVKPQHNDKWPFAQKVNHISPKMVKDCPAVQKYVPELQKIFDNADILVSYNGRFDVNFLEDAGIKIDEKKPHLDVIKSFSELYGEPSYSDKKGFNGFKYQKLTTAADYYGLEIDAHNSIGDCISTLDVAKKIYGENLEKLTPEIIAAHTIDAPKISKKNQEKTMDPDTKYEFSFNKEIVERHTISETEEKYIQQFFDEHHFRDTVGSNSEYNNFMTFFDFHNHTDEFLDFLESAAELGSDLWVQPNGNQRAVEQYLCKKIGLPLRYENGQIRRWSQEEIDKFGAAASNVNILAGYIVNSGIYVGRDEKGIPFQTDMNGREMLKANGINTVYDINDYLQTLSSFKKINNVTEEHAQTISKESSLSSLHGQELFDFLLDSFKNTEFENNQSFREQFNILTEKLSPEQKKDFTDYVILATNSKESDDFQQIFEKFEQYVKDAKTASLTPDKNITFTDIPEKESDSLQFTKTPNYPEPQEGEPSVSPAPSASPIPETEQTLSNTIENSEENKTEQDISSAEEKESFEIKKENLTYKDFLLKAAQLKTPEQYKEFYDKNFNFPVAKFVMKSPVAEKKLQLFMSNKPTTVEIDAENEKDFRKWMRWAYEKKNHAIFVPEPKDVEEKGMKWILNSIKQLDSIMNTNMSQELNGNSISENSSAAKTEQKNELITPNLYMGSEWSKDELELIKHVEMDKIPSFLNNPYETNVTVPRFGTSVKDPKTGETKLQEMSGWSFARKEIIAGCVSSIILTKVNESGEREFFKMEPTTYESIINRNKELIHEWNKPRFKTTHLKTLYEYENSLGISKLETRSNTCSEFFHNFEASCRGANGESPAKNETEAMECAKKVYLSMSQHEKDRMHRMESDWNNTHDTSFQEELIRRFYNIRKDIEITKEQMRYAGHELQTSSDETKGSVVSKAILDDAAVRGEIDPVSHKRIGDTVKISIKAKGANNHIVSMPVTEMKIAGANRETNAILLIDEKHNTEYNLPLDKMITFLQSQELKKNKELQKLEKQEKRKERKDIKEYSFEGR